MNLLLKKSWRWKLVAVLCLVCAGALVYAQTNRPGRGGFALAEDVPRGALVFAQFEDLPGLLKRWEESSLKERYLESTNFRQFARGHLALKLIERWEEFGGALDFPLDLTVIGGAAEKSAALALYDIGRLELVFVAPIGEGKAEAIRFIQSKGNFEERQAPDGTIYYSREVETDRGRQKQQLAFALHRGRFILTTSEPLLLRSLANRGAGKDRLADEPSFQTLSRAATPHFVTVWVDQAKLNDDWYFKRYWAMRNLAELKKIRAGLFDWELRDDRWIERRDFLWTTEAAPAATIIPAEDAERARALVPPGTPFFKLHGLDAGQSAELIRETLFDRPQLVEKDSRSWHWQSYDESDFSSPDDGERWEGGANSRYAYLSDRYDSTIDDPHDARSEGGEEETESDLRAETERRALESLRQLLGPARPAWTGVIESPQKVGGPLFAEFRRAAIISLREPAAFDRGAFERALAGAAESRLIIANRADSRLAWTSGRAGPGHEWRELTLPMLGWKLCYLLRGHELIVASHPELLATMLAVEGREKNAEPASPLHDLTILSFARKRQAFDEIFATLDAEQIKAYRRSRAKEEGAAELPSEEFFSGNVGSLLDVASHMSRLEIRRRQSPERLHEEIEMFFD